MFFGDLGGWDGGGLGGRSKREGIYVYIYLIHFIVQQKLTQHGKATIPSPKNPKNKNTQLPLLKSWEKNRVSGAKARYCTCPLHSIPPEGWANHLSCTSILTPGPPLPSPHIGNQLSPHWRMSKRTCYFFMAK